MKEYFFGATLGAIIKKLEALPPDMVVENGFCNPHSYRGNYYDLAFEPAENVTVEEMLRCVKDALGRTFMGWKGGEYLMTVSHDPNTRQLFSGKNGRER